MSRLRTLFRLIYINFILMRHGLDEIILATHLFAPLRFLAYFNPHNWFRNKKQTRGARIRHALEDLGPIFVKFGQILSTRRDLLPDDIADELALLQDKVPPFSNNLAKHIIEKAYGDSIENIFKQFDEQPMASASIAQVHSAELTDGSQVVVKVLRPQIKKIITRDVALLYVIAKLTQRYWSEGPRLKPVEIVAEFERTIFDELDLLREAANSSQLRRNFKDSAELYVPEIHWSYARSNVIVMERIHGIRISDIKALKEKRVDLKVLAERGVKIFFTQVFRDCFFHADMHPGNIFVNIENPHQPQYLAVDFGIMGTLTRNDQRYLAENFLAFFKRDYRRVAELHVESGWVPPTTRIDDFESAIRMVCEPIFERPLGDISFGQMLVRLFQVARRFDMEVQPQLLLLQKTLLNVEGLGRQLYPQLDLWSTAKPFLEQWLKSQVGPKALLRKLKVTAPFWAEKFPEIPGLVYDLLTHNKHQQQMQQYQLTQMSQQQSTHASRARKWGVLFGLGLALVLAAVVDIAFKNRILTLPETLPQLTWLLGGLGFASILVAFWQRDKES